MSDNHSRSVPDLANQTYRNVANGQSPAARANPQCNWHNVAGWTVGPNVSRWALYWTVGLVRRADPRLACMNVACQFLADNVVDAGTSRTVGPE